MPGRTTDTDTLLKYQRGGSVMEKWSSIEFLWPQLGIYPISDLSNSERWRAGNWSRPLANSAFELIQCFTIDEVRSVAQLKSSMVPQKWAKAIRCKIFRPKDTHTLAEMSCSGAVASNREDSPTSAATTWFRDANIWSFIMRFWLTQGNKMLSSNTSSSLFMIIALTDDTWGVTHLCWVDEWDTRENLLRSNCDVLPEPNKHRCSRRKSQPNQCGLEIGHRRWLTTIDGMDSPQPI